MAMQLLFMCYRRSIFVSATCLESIIGYFRLAPGGAGFRFILWHAEAFVHVSSLILFGSWPSFCAEKTGEIRVEDQLRLRNLNLRLFAIMQVHFCSACMSHIVWESSKRVP